MTKHRKSKFNDLQKIGAMAMASRAKSVKVVSNQKFNEEIVGYVAICKHCGKINHYKIIAEVLFSKKELMCDHCKAMYPINPIPAIMEVDDLEQKIDDLLKKENGK